MAHVTENGGRIDGGDLPLLSREGDAPLQYVVVGRVSGLFGIHGWLKVFSHTRPRENILGYAVWYLHDGEGWQPRRLLKGSSRGKGMIALLEGYDERDRAATLVGQEIAIQRTQLPSEAADEFYWTDLIGCQVETIQGRVLGKVHSLLETGANDVMVVDGERERLLPFTATVVVEVNLDTRRICVDWDPDF